VIEQQIGSSLIVSALNAEHTVWQCPNVECTDVVVVAIELLIIIALDDGEVVDAVCLADVANNCGQVVFKLII
jgi:hypothetical protein